MSLSSVRDKLISIPIRLLSSQLLGNYFMSFPECEVRCALESITTNKASGGDGIPAELFQILKDDAVKVLHSICQQIWKTQQWPWDWKRSVFIPIPKKGNAKECSNYQTNALISHASKVMLKILQARLQQSVNCEIPNVQAGFRKGRGGEGNGNPLQYSCLEIPWTEKPGGLQSMGLSRV